MTRIRTSGRAARSRASTGGHAPWIALFVWAAVGCGVESHPDQDAAVPMDAGPECEAPAIACGDECVDTSRDRDHCGACGASCAGGELCVGGVCSTSCPAGQIACEGACVSPERDRAYCGASGDCAGGNAGAQCGDGEACVDGSCTTSCPAGQTLCDGACVSTDRDPENCGACGSSCASGEVCAAGTCTTSCPAGQLACDGACVSTDRDPENCGACGSSCGDGEVCAAGTCTTSCPPGQVVCGSACVSTYRDRENCGTCGNTCGDGEVCAAGSCATSCPAGQAVCDGACVSIDRDRENCGACGSTCATGEVCVAASCATSCPAGQIACGGACANPMTDRTYCGASGDCLGASAGEVCGALELCVSGACTPAVCAVDSDCDDGAYCNGSETCDPSSSAADPRGCVAASTPCAAGETCDEAADVCRDVCATDPDADGDGADAVMCGGTDCDDTAPGFVLGDWAHCGACGVSCAAGQACSAGACISARRVFLTSTTHAGNFGGVAGGDAICQARADAAGLGGTWRAYLVDGTSGLGRLTHPAVPYVRLDGTRVANSWADLSNESIAAPIDLTELRTTGTGTVWTGLTNVTGGTNQHCNDWTYAGAGCLSGSACGGGGEARMTNDHWDGYYVFSCSSRYRLYCIEL